MARARMPAWQLFNYEPKKDASGRWIARGRYNDDTGRRHDIKRSGGTKGAADLALRRAVEHLKRQSDQRREEAEKAQTELHMLTLQQLSELWLAERKPAPAKVDHTQTAVPATNEIRMQTWACYESSVRLHILPALGKLAVDQLKTATCESAIQGLFDKKAGTGYRRAAMAKQVLKQILDYGVRQGYRTDNPVRYVSRIPTPQKNPVRLSPSTLAAVQTAVEARQPEPGIGGPRPTSRLSDIVLFLRYTGLRVGEALAVRWDDLRQEGSSYLVTVSGTLVERNGAFYRQNYPKSEKSRRTLQLTSGVIVSMIGRRYIGRRPTRTNAVFATRNGTFVRPSNFRADLKKAVVGSNITERVNPHAFRSTVGSEIAEAYDREAAQQQLGHSSPETTQKYYIHRPDLVPDFSSSFEHEVCQENEGQDH